MLVVLLAGLHPRHAPLHLAEELSVVPDKVGVPEGQTTSLGMSFLLGGDSMRRVSTFAKPPAIKFAYKALKLRFVQREERQDALYKLFLVVDLDCFATMHPRHYQSCR